MNNKNKTSRFYNLFSAFFAFIMWGSWAYFVNSGSQHSSQYSGLFSGLAQGMASFVITLFLVHAVTRLYHRLPTGMPRLVQMVLPALITVSFTGTGLFIIHSLAGTPHIGKTIAPALLVAFLFCVYTVHQLIDSHNKS